MLCLRVCPALLSSVLYIKIYLRLLNLSVGKLVKFRLWHELSCWENFGTPTVTWIVSLGKFSNSNCDMNCLAGKILNLQLWRELSCCDIFGTPTVTWIVLLGKFWNSNCDVNCLAGKILKLQLWHELSCWENFGTPTVILTISENGNMIFAQDFICFTHYISVIFIKIINLNKWQHFFFYSLKRRVFLVLNACFEWRHMFKVPSFLFSWMLDSGRRQQKTKQNIDN